MKVTFAAALIVFIFGVVVAAPSEDKRKEREPKFFGSWFTGDRGWEGNYGGYGSNTGGSLGGYGRRPGSVPTYGGYGGSRWGGYGQGGYWDY